jgi:hypothetical protein
MGCLTIVGPAQALASTSGADAAGGSAPAKPRPTPTPTPRPTPTPSPAPAPWRLVTSPNPDQFNNVLSAVAAVASNDVWAVGQTGVSTLAEHWNGSSWTVVPTPNPATTGAAQNALLAVAAVSGTDVWAVGYSITDSYATLAMHWDGSRWSLVPTPNPPARDFNSGPILTAITAISSTDVWAVGGQLFGQYESPAVIEHWNGSAWSLVSAGALDNVQCVCSLSWVAGRAANDVWAGGLPLLHWDGTAWSQVTGAGQQQTAASASSTSNVWAVGSFRVCGGETGCFGGPTSDRFDGSSWSNTVPANPSGTEALDGVAAFAPGDVWAVGFSGAVSRTLAEHWTGSAWSVVPTANANLAGTNVLRAVAGASSTDLWAVGSYLDGAGDTLTLVEHYTG